MNTFTPINTSPSSIQQIENEPELTWDETGLAFLHDVPTPPPSSNMSNYDWINLYAFFHLRQTPLDPSTLEMLLEEPCHLLSCTYCRSKHHSFPPLKCGCTHETLVEVTDCSHYCIQTYCKYCSHRELHTCTVQLLVEAIELEKKLN